MELLKVTGLMKIVTDVGIFYEKLVNEFIVKIIIECNIKGIKEYRKVYGIGKCVKLSP